MVQWLKIRTISKYFPWGSVVCGHLGIMIDKKHPRLLWVTYGTYLSHNILIPHVTCCFREVDFWNFNQLENIIGPSNRVGFPKVMKIIQYHILRTIHVTFLPSSVLIGSVVSEEKKKMQEFTNEDRC